MSAYLEITLKIKSENRAAAAAVYEKYKKPFLNKIAGAKTKELLVRDEDVQVFHGFTSEESAQAYLSSEIFTNDVVNELKPLLEADPEIRIYGLALVAVEAVETGGAGMTLDIGASPAGISIPSSKQSRVMTHVTALHTRREAEAKL